MSLFPQVSVDVNRAGDEASPAADEAGSSRRDAAEKDLAPPSGDLAAYPPDDGSPMTKKCGTLCEVTDAKMCLLLIC